MHDGWVGLGDGDIPADTQDTEHSAVEESISDEQEIAEVETPSQTEAASQQSADTKPEAVESADQSISADSIPAYSGKPYAEINNNIPTFTEEEKVTTSFEQYSELDHLGRAQTAYVCAAKDIMPTETRGAIGSVEPTGWHLVKYDFVDGKFLYNNRCHLIGYQISGENANERNLITGTRYMNVKGMLPFENEIADYMEQTDNHVLFRVTPVYEGDNLLADGVLMEAYSVEDQGAGVSFYVFTYNVQPGVVIDYATGDNHEADDADTTDEQVADSENEDAASSAEQRTYVIHKNTKKFHTPDCGSVADIKPKNKETYTGNRDELLNRGYDPCKRCNP